MRITKNTLTKQSFIDKAKASRVDRAEHFDYSLVPDFIGNNKTKVTLICTIHDYAFEQIPLDHYRNYSGCKECSILKRERTNLERHGVVNYTASPEFKTKLSRALLENYADDEYFKDASIVEKVYSGELTINPSSLRQIKDKKSKTFRHRYGATTYLQSDIGRSSIKATNLQRYGVENLSSLPQTKKKVMETRLKNGSFDKTNSSKIATSFFIEYMKSKGYSIDRVAFSCPDMGLFEWGYNIDGKWVLYDFVAFELGHRGDKNCIIEIVEFHGPFHYTDDDVKSRGDMMAYPWKSKITTIRQSREKDILKEEFAKTLTPNYKVVWHHALADNMNDLLYNK